MHLQITLAALFFVLLSFSHNAFATGDCNGDGTVTIAEIQSAINMFLGLTIPPTPCVDEDRSGSVSIAEVQKTINTFPKFFSVTGAVTLDGSGLAGVTVTLYRTNFVIYTYYNMYGAYLPVLSSVAASTTGADGSYSFNGVGSGSYAIIVPKQSGYFFSPDTDKIKFFTIINNDSSVYIYDHYHGLNSVLGNPPTIIYDSTMPISGNTVPGWNFTASKPGGTGI